MNHKGPMLMNILFLDFDGVLNSAASYELHYAFLKYEEEAKNRFYNKSDLIKFKPDLGPGCRADEFCPIAVSNLGYIFRKLPDLKVVVSSFWRMGNTIEGLKEIFTWLGLPADRIIDKTPYIAAVQRGFEIMTWIKESGQPVTKYAILDDDDDMEGTNLDWFFKTDPLDGLTHSQAIKIIKHFEGNK
jgi:hypothetical protein